MVNKKDLNILCSIRVRLTPEQRQTLKNAYREQQLASASPLPPVVNRGSTITVQHAQTNTDINTRLGLPNMVVVDLLNTREAISLPTLLHIQSELGVRVIDKGDLTKAFTGYIDYCLDKFNES